MYHNEALDQREEKKWITECSKVIDKVKSFEASIAILNANRALHNDALEESKTLLTTEMEFQKQKLRLLTKSDGVFYMATVIQVPSKLYKFVVDDDLKLIRFIGFKDRNGNVVDDISPFNNIGDIVLGVFNQGQFIATDLSELDIHEVKLKLISPMQFASQPFIKIIIQDIEMQGQQDYSDLTFFVNHHILKRVTIEAGVVVTDVYGTVVNVHH